jgi:hypothetical protein
MIGVMHNDTHIGEFHDKKSRLVNLRVQRESSRFLYTSLLLCESPSLVLVINDTKLLMSCVKCFELGISNICDEGVRGKEWWPQDHKEMVHGHEMTIMVEMHII